VQPVVHGARLFAGAVSEQLLGPRGLRLNERVVLV